MRTDMEVYNQALQNGELNGSAFQKISSFTKKRKWCDNGNKQQVVVHDNSPEGVAARGKRQRVNQQASDMEVKLCTASESAGGVMGSAGGASDIFLFDLGVQLRCINLEGGRGNMFKIGNIVTHWFIISRSAWT